MKLYYSTETNSWWLNGHIELITGANGKLTEVVGKSTNLFTYEQLKDTANLTDQEVTILQLKFGDMPIDYDSVVNQILTDLGAGGPISKTLPLYVYSSDLDPEIKQRLTEYLVQTLL